MTNLYLTLLDRIGVRQESIGDSTGQIAHLSEVYSYTRCGSRPELQLGHVRAAS